MGWWHGLSVLTYCLGDPILPSVFGDFSARELKKGKWLVSTLTVPQAWRTKLPFFSKCAQRSWRNCGAAAALPVLRARIFWVEQRLNSRLLWEGLLTLNFKRAAFFSGSDAVTVSYSCGQAAVRGTLGTGLGNPILIPTSTEFRLWQNMSRFFPS